jgi:hypothetical protein
MLEAKVSSTSVRSRVIAGAAVLLMSMSGSAFAAYFCEGRVLSVTVSPSGVVTLNAPDAGMRYAYLCVMGATENGVSPDACKGIMGTLLAAASSGQKVQFGYNDSSSCGARPSWAWATGWYWGPTYNAE